MFFLKKFWYSAAVLGLVLSWPLFAQAETDRQPPGDAAVPGAVSLFFRSVTESVQLLFTFDPVKDAAERVGFAERNLTTALSMVTQSTDSIVHDRALKLIASADEYLASVAKDKDTWSKGDATAVRNLLQKIEACLTLRQQTISEMKAALNSEKQAQLGVLDAAGAALVASLQSLAAGDPKSPETLSGIGPSSLPTNDRDRDGVPDDQEKELGISNSDFDTDGDSLSDKNEIQVYGTDPTNPDTDGDGYRDGLEVLKGYNPNGLGTLEAAKATTKTVESFKFLATVKQKQLSSTTLDLITKALNKQLSVQ